MAKRISRGGYRSAHQFVTKTRGRAVAQSCGCGRRAAHWAYDHKDPAEVREFVEGSGGGWRTFSRDPDHYIPLCRSCHYHFDGEHTSYRMPDLFSRPITEWSLDELARGYASLGRYIRWRRSEARPAEAA